MFSCIQSETSGTQYLFTSSDVIELRVDADSVIVPVYFIYASCVCCVDHHCGLQTNLMGLTSELDCISLAIRNAFKLLQ